MASLTIEHRDGPRGRKYRPVLEWPVAGAARPGRAKGSWTRYWRSAKIVGGEMLKSAEDYRLGIKKAAPSRTWGQLAAEYEAYSRKDKQPATWQNWDRPALEAFTAFLSNPSAPLAAITSETVGRWRAHLEDVRGLAPNTVAGYGRHLAAAFAYAVRPLRWIPENPCAGVPWPAYTPTGRPIEDDDLTYLLERAPERLRPLAWLARGTGARAGELVNLDHRQVDRAAGCLRVMSHRRRGIRSAWRPKTEASVRQIPVPAELWPLLGPAAASGPVFPDYTRARWNPVGAVTQDFAKARAAALRDAREGKDKARAERLAAATFHDLKHSFCTTYLERGGSTAKLSELTGTSEATLKKTYAHLTGRLTAADISFAAHPRFHPKSGTAGPLR